MKKILLFLTTLLVTSAVFSQSADFVTRLLDTEEATFGQVCYLCAVCQELVPDTANETDAFNAIFEQGTIPTGIQPGDKINYKHTAAIFSKVWDLKGGFFYMITKGSPRYAFKQLKLDNVILQRADPSMIPSGVDILNIYTMGDKKYGSTATEGVKK